MKQKIVVPSIPIFKGLHVNQDYRQHSKIEFLVITMVKIFSKKSCWYKISDTTCMSENMPGWRGVKLIPSNKSQIVCASSLPFGTCSGSRVFSPSISAALNWRRISLHWTIFVACFCVLILSGLQSDLCCLQHWYVTGGKSRWLCLTSPFLKLPRNDQDKNCIGFISRGRKNRRKRNTIVDKWQMPIGAIFFPNQIPHNADNARYSAACTEI